MPYITEEIYQNLNIASKEKYESIWIAEYPTVIDYGLRVAEIKEISKKIFVLCWFRLSDGVYHSNM